MNTTDHMASDSTDQTLTADEVRYHIARVDSTIARWEANDPTPRASLPRYRACSVELHALLADMESDPTPTDALTLDFETPA